MTIKSSDFIAFVDGVGDIFKIDNGAEEGDRPKAVLRHKYHLRFRWHVVGLARFYEALQAQVKIVKAVDMPLIDNVNPQDIVIIGGKQYRIEQKQEKHDTKPASMVLSLSDIEEEYEVNDVR